MSMKPGARQSPRASSSRAPRASTRPTAAMRSPRMATSPANAGAPVPSTMEALRMTRSKSLMGPDPTGSGAAISGSGVRDRLQDCGDFGGALGARVGLLRHQLHHQPRHRLGDLGLALAR